jgi:LAS superfamily LD-carboxypeptidase LdcB
MKRSLLALLLISLMLLSYGCSDSPEQKETLPQNTMPTTDTSPTVPATEPQIEVTEPSEEATHPTEAATDPTTPATEPTTAPTEPTTQPPKPTTKPTQPTENTKPTVKPTKPTTKPTTPTTKPVITGTPDEPGYTGWAELNGNRCYYSKGSLHTGWLSLDGDRYYFYEDGTMAVGKVKVPGSGTRYFTSTGKECILVNPWNYVPDDYSVKLSKYGDYKVAKICLNDLKEMIADCKSNGKKAVVVSAYRSHSYQEGLYERRIQRFLDQGYDYETAVIEAGKRVAVPGTSEHELGLAVDIVDVNYQNLDKKQEDTAAQQWLIANSWKYGFILRYPNEKSAVTGIIYEPWHYRYVGKELAKELHESGLCLEEYFASLT